MEAKSNAERNATENLIFKGILPVCFACVICVNFSDGIVNVSTVPWTFIN